MDSVIVFDGCCSLCARSVGFILERDLDGVFKFAASQSGAGAALLAKAGLDAEAGDTVVLIENGTAYTRSEAALRIAARFHGPWRLLTWFRAVPRPLREWAYRIIARKRYAWFGGRRECLVPPEDVRDRFLD